LPLVTCTGFGSPGFVGLVKLICAGRSVASPGESRGHDWAHVPRGASLMRCPSVRV
jgi:hypothetical protein